MSRPRYITITKSFTCTQMHVKFDWHLPEPSKQLLLSCDEYSVLDKLYYIIFCEWQDGPGAVNRISWVSTYRVPRWLYHWGISIDRILTKRTNTFPIYFKCMNVSVYFSSVILVLLSIKKYIFVYNTTNVWLSTLFELKSKYNKALQYWRCIKWGVQIWLVYYIWCRQPYNVNV